MSALTLELCEKRDRLGLKGPRAAEWLAAHQSDDVVRLVNRDVGLERKTRQNFASNRRRTRLAAYDECPCRANVDGL